MAYKLNRGAVAEGLHHELLTCELINDDSVRIDLHIEGVFADRANALHDSHEPAWPTLQPEIAPRHRHRTTRITAMWAGRVVTSLEGAIVALEVAAKSADVPAVTKGAGS